MRSWELGGFKSAWAVKINLPAVEHLRRCTQMVTRSIFSLRSLSPLVQGYIIAVAWPNIDLFRRSTVSRNEWESGNSECEMEMGIGKWPQDRAINMNQEIPTRLSGTPNLNTLR